MNIGIVGSRKRTRHEDYIALYDKFSYLYKHIKTDIPVTIVSGGCKSGADSWAEDIADDFGLKKVIYYPNFEKYGIPGCYFVRNELIAEHSDTLIAVVSEDRTGGTEDTIRKFQQYHPEGDLVLI